MEIQQYNPNPTHSVSIIFVADQPAIRTQFSELRLAFRAG
jgi:hypothetical protein